MTAPSDPPQPGQRRLPGPPSTQEFPAVQGTSGLPAQPSDPAPGPAPAPSPGPAAAADGPLPTGPVDFVPGLPGPGTPPPPPATAGSALPPPPGAAPPVPVAPQPVPSEPVPVRTEQLSPTAGTPVWPDSLDEGARSSGARPADAPADGPAPRSVPRLRGRTPAPRALVGLGLAALGLGLLEVGLIAEFGTWSYWSGVTLWSAFATACAVLGVVAFLPLGQRLRRAPAWRLAAGGLLGIAAFWLLVVLPEVASDRGFVLTAAMAALAAALWVGAADKS